MRPATADAIRLPLALCFSVATCICRFGNAWVSPMPSAEVVARLEMRVDNGNGSRFTIGAFDGQNNTRVGFVSQFGNVSKQVVLTRTEGTTGMTGG